MPDYAGNTLSVSITLRHSVAPTGPVAGATVVTGPAGASSTVQTVIGISDANAVVTVNFPLSAQGSFHIDVNFAGTTCLRATVRSVDLNIYLRSFLLLRYLW